jgi:hypothetical protein
MGFFSKEINACALYKVLGVLHTAVRRFAHRDASRKAFCLFACGVLLTRRNREGILMIEEKIVVTPQAQTTLLTQKEEIHFCGSNLTYIKKHSARIENVSCTTFVRREPYQASINIHVDGDGLIRTKDNSARIRNVFHATLLAEEFLQVSSNIHVHGDDLIHTKKEFARIKNSSAPERELSHKKCAFVVRRRPAARRHLAPLPPARRTQDGRVSP